jgi:hypothetical protein
MTFSDDLNRMLAETAPPFLGEAFGGPKAEPPPTITVARATGYLQVSPELALDAGVITEEEARALGWKPAPRAPWHRRARWRWQAWRERVGRRIGGWIAGVDLTERDDY